MRPHTRLPAHSWWLTNRAKRFLAMIVVTVVAFTAGCATQQQTGGVLGGLGGAVAGSIIGASTGGSSRDRGQRAAIGGVIGGAVGALAGSVIGARLDEADRQRAEAAAQRAIAEREAAVQRAAAARSAEIERQLRVELAQARSAAERAEAERRAVETREAALREATARASAPPVAWSGNARGSAQAVGPVQVAGRTDCEQVREIAVIQGQEVRQTATFCRDSATGGLVRV